MSTLCVRLRSSRLARKAFIRSVAAHDSEEAQAWEKYGMQFVALNGKPVRKKKKRATTLVG